ncbi:MAG: mechanosensitive ion channel family protein, partial [Aliiglaciecola sp.]
DHIQIPNSTVYKNIIRNISANPNSRGNFVIGVGYDSSVVEAQKLAMTVLHMTEAVLKEPEPQVLVDNLGSSTVNLRVYFWIDTHQHSLLKVSSLLMRTILNEFEQAGISMPDDAREVIFPDGIKLTGADHLVADKQKQQESDEEKDKLLKKQDNQLDNKALSTKIKNQHQDADFTEDLSSDADTIREQAKSARNPEQGQNIL